MVPWPWIKASHPVRGHGCFRLGPRGGHPLERAYINLIPCYSRLWSPRLKSFSWTMSRVIPSIKRYDGCVLVCCVFFRNTINGTSPSGLRKSVDCGKIFVQTLQSHIFLQIISSMSSFVPSYPNQLSALMTETPVNHMSAKSDWMITPVDGLTRLFSWIECLLWVLFTDELLKPFLRCRSDVRLWYFF